MSHKSCLCKHPDSCISNAIKGFIRGLFISTGFKLAVSLAKAIIKFKIFTDPKSVLKLSYSDLNLIFFLSGLIGIQRSVLCTLRRLTNNEKLSSFFSGCWTTNWIRCVASRGSATSLISD